MADENPKEDSYLRVQRTKGKSLRELTADTAELKRRLDGVEGAYPTADEEVENRLNERVDKLTIDYEGTRDAHVKRMDKIEVDYVKHGNEASAAAEKRARDHADAQDKVHDTIYQSKFTELGTAIIGAQQAAEQLKELVRTSEQTRDDKLAATTEEAAKQLTEALAKVEKLSTETIESVESTIATYRNETDARLAAIETGREQDRAEYQRNLSAVERRLNRKLERGAKVFSDELNFTEEVDAEGESTETALPS